VGLTKVCNSDVEAANSWRVQPVCPSTSRIAKGLRLEKVTSRLGRYCRLVGRYCRQAKGKEQACWRA
jgi:hypothetical protein